MCDILYFCDKKACGSVCPDPACDMTTDIEHAKNFRKIGPHIVHDSDLYVERMSIVDEVIKGLCGNGRERMESLEAAGYDYRKVQEEVNRRMLHSVQTKPKRRFIILERTRKFKKSLFWRDRYCDECAAHLSSSNRSPCNFCRRGDLAYQNFDNEDDWWDEYKRRVRLDI